MALFRADIAGILTVRTFKMLFQIVFRESGVGKESAASVRKRPDIFLQRSEGSVIACEQLFRLIKTGRRNRGINRCKLRNLLAGTLVVKIREVAALRSFSSYTRISALYCELVNGTVFPFLSYCVIILW